MSTDSSFQEVLDSIDMEYYLDREAIEYKHTYGSSGPQLNIRECPVCGGSDWKVYIGAETGFGNCFHGSCEAKFNKYTFIRAHTGAATTHAMRAHITEVAREMGWRPVKKIIKAVEDAPDWEMPFSYELPVEDGRNLEYLERRGITPEVTRYFHLRYCHQGWYNFVDEEGNKRGQRFDERVIIPVYDLAGKLVTFQGRDITGEAERKYLFPMKLPATGRHLYNGHNAVGATAICAGEGAFDVIAIKMDFDNALDLRDVAPVGTFGKHLSIGDLAGNDQLGRIIELKNRGLKEWTTMWDGEALALDAAIKAGELIRSIGVRAYVALLPKGKDPNEVPPGTVAKAYRDRIEVTPTNAVKLRLRNPYKQTMK